MGLTLMLDSHNDLTADSSVESDYQGFVALISDKGTVPLTHQKVIQERIVSLV
jgi:hypothetical protein